MNHMRIKTAALAVFSVFSATAIASDDTVIVTANRFSTKETETTYSTEIHSRKQIEQSAAATLYDYLAQQSSVNILPSYGNRATPKTDFRGYGIGDGHQNIVVTLDGVRLNNIDMSGTLIGAIPLAEIDRIEITKGSGSVLYGDGAAAGTIQIHTRKRNGAALLASVGSNGTADVSVSAGLNKEKFSLSATASHDRSDGTSNADATGNKDASRNNSWRFDASAMPTETLSLNVGAAHSQIETRYVNKLSLAQFSDDPATANGTFPNQLYDANSWKAGFDLRLSSAFKLSASHNAEEKVSRYESPTWTSRYDYDYKSNELVASYTAENGAKAMLGVQQFDGARVATAGTMRKENMAFFVQGEHQRGDTTYSAGVRSETVKYRYNGVGASLDDTHQLSAWDIGFNHRMSEAFSVFGNLNDAFQAPDIDRFFDPVYDVSWNVVGQSFNAFIQPMHARTLNLGFNHVSPAYRVKASAFYTALRDEIYYDATSFTNTNIDRSHKYGLELQNQWQAGKQFAVSLNYAYVRAVIDDEDMNGGAYSGKELPGVPNHSAHLGLNWKASDKTAVDLMQVWRSQAYAANDFTNSFAQKQTDYLSTNLSVRHSLGRVELFGAVDNLFNRANGLWIKDNAIYPVNFSRTWKLGVKATF